MLDHVQNYQKFLVVPLYHDEKTRFFWTDNYVIIS